MAKVTTKAPSQYTRAPTTTSLDYFIGHVYKNFPSIKALNLKREENDEHKNRQIKRNERHFASYEFDLIGLILGMRPVVIRSAAGQEGKAVVTPSG